MVVRRTHFGWYLFPTEGCGCHWGTFWCLIVPIGGVVGIFWLITVPYRGLRMVAEVGRVPWLRELWRLQVPLGTGAQVTDASGSILVCWADLSTFVVQGGRI